MTHVLRYDIQRIFGTPSCLNYTTSCLSGCCGASGKISQGDYVLSTHPKGPIVDGHLQRIHFITLARPRTGTAVCIEDCIIEIVAEKDLHRMIENFERSGHLKRSKSRWT